MTPNWGVSRNQIDTKTDTTDTKLGCSSESLPTLKGERSESLTNGRNFHSCASIKKWELKDENVKNRDYQVRAEKANFEAGCLLKDRNNFSKNASRALAGGINFSSKLVKVTREDMIEKPKRTRNWKGRRAAERNRMKMDTSSRLQPTLHPPSEFPALQKPHFASPEPPPNNHIAFRHELQSPVAQDNNGENFTEFLTSLEDVANMEEHLQWALPYWVKTPLDAVVVGQLDKACGGVEGHLQRNCGCATQGMKTNSGARWAAKGVGPSLGKDEDEVTLGAMWNEYGWRKRCWRFFFEIFVEKVLESERLKRQEDEIVGKIERYLKRYERMKDEKKKINGEKSPGNKPNEKLEEEGIF